MDQDANSLARAERARRLIHSLRARGEATLAQLAKDANISRPTASIIVADLETERLVIQSSTSSGAPARRLLLVQTPARLRGRPGHPARRDIDHRCDHLGEGDPHLHHTPGPAFPPGAAGRAV